MLKRTLLTVSLAGFALFVLACGGMDPEEEEYRSAAPTLSSLSFAVPTGQGASTSSDGVGFIKQALLGQRADLYQLTYDVSKGLNRSIWIGLNTIEAIIQRPCSSIIGGVATWGPWTPTLEPLTWMLKVTRKGPGQYAYVLLARKKADKAGAFQVILAGNSTKGYSPIFSGYVGLYTANASNLHALDAITYPNTGKMMATYNTTGLQRQVKLVLTDYSENGGPKSGATYRYLDRADTSGEFRFVTRTDLQENNSLKELLVVGTAWTKTGAGRGDAAATGGDIIPGVTVRITECWDSSFARVFYKDNHNIKPAEGDPSKCVFAAPLP